jgi:hypothetical protein
MLTAGELAALETFRLYRVSCGKLMCFQTPQLEKHVVSLRQLAKKGLVEEEHVACGFSLTREGAQALFQAEAGRPKSRPVAPVAVRRRGNSTQAK